MEDMQKMMKFFEQAKILSQMMELNNNQSAGGKKNDFEPKYFDDEIMSFELKTLKTIIPYFDYEVQKPIALYVKLLEICNIIDFYDKNPAPENKPKSPNWKKEMLASLRIHMNDEKKKEIDQLIKTLDMYDIITKMKEVKN